jgi:hypothetical protein
MIAINLNLVGEASNVRTLVLLIVVFAHTQSVGNSNYLFPTDNSNNLESWNTPIAYPPTEESTKISIGENVNPAI